MTTTETVPARADAADEALLELGHELKASEYEFTTVTPATHARVNRRPENATARTLRDVFGWSRPFADGVVPEHMLTLLRDAGAIEPAGGLWRSRVRFSSYDGELFVHSAFPTEASDAVFFGPDTYRIADAAAAYLKGRTIGRAVDLGTGTGAGAIVVAKRAPGAQVFAVDINPHALHCTRVNAALAGTDGVVAVRSDLLGGVDGEFDLIVSNPPFMADPAGRLYRDGGGPEGHDLTLRVIRTAAQRLAPGCALVLLSGTGIVDGHDPLRSSVARLLAGTGLAWDYREVEADEYGEELEGPAYARAERVAVVLLTATRCGR